MDAVCHFYAAVEREKPDVVIQLGDAMDFYSHSKFARSHDICTPDEEFRESRKFMENFWITCRKLSSKKTRHIQLTGNHEARVLKRIYEKYPEIAVLVDQKSILTFPGVETVHDPRGWVEIDDTIYCHGFFSKPGDHMRFFLKNVIFGHTHRAWTMFMNQYGKTLFEVSSGYMADPNSVPMSYTATKRTNWVKGYTMKDEYGPRFIAL